MKHGPQDYRRVAAILGKHVDGMTEDCLLQLTNEFIRWFKSENPEFEPARFRVAVTVAAGFVKRDQKPE